MILNAEDKIMLEMILHAEDKNPKNQDQGREREITREEKLK